MRGQKTMKRLVLLTYVLLCLSGHIARAVDRTCDDYTKYEMNSPKGSISAVQDPSNHCDWKLTATPAMGYKFAYWQNIYGSKIHENPVTLSIDLSRQSTLLQAMFVRSNAYLYEWRGDSVCFATDSTDIFGGSGAGYVSVCINNGVHDFETEGDAGLHQHDPGLWRKETSGIHDGNKYAGMSLHYVFFDDCDKPTAVIDTIVPVMIAGDSLASEVNFHTDTITDVQVFNGAVLTIDANTTISGTLDIHAGGKVVVQSGVTLTVNGIIMRGNGKKKLWPQLIVNGSITNNNSNIIYYDYTLDATEYYPLAVPYDVNCSEITNRLTGRAASFEVNQYNTSERAAGNTGWEVFNDAAVGAKLIAGKGYSIYAVPRKWKKQRQARAVVRFPMVANLSAAPEAEKTIAVNYSSDESGKQVDRNWNLIGNPYLADFTVSATGDTTKLLAGYYDWDSENSRFELQESAGAVRYITYSNDGFRSYEQTRIKGFRMKSFNCYFTQTIAGDGLLFAKSDRAQMAPRRRAAAQYTTQEIEVGITLTQGEQVDHTGLLYGDYTDAYEVNADLAKQFGQLQPMSLYSLNNGQPLAYQALAMDDISRSVPLGYRKADNAPMTFAWDEDYDRSEIEEVWLTDMVTGENTNLLLEPYTCTPSLEQADQRFYINIVPKNTKNITTSIDETFSPEDVVRVIDMLGRDVPLAPSELPNGVYVLINANGQSKKVMIR